MQNTIFLMSLVFAHLMGDFVFQTSKLAKNKEKSIRGIIRHVIIVLIVNIAVLSNFSLFGVVAAVLIAISHFIIDYVKRVTKVCCKCTTIHNLADQVLHFLFIFICFFYFKDMVGAPIINIKYIGVLNYIILITFVSTVFAKTIICDISQVKQLSCEFFLEYERVFDCLIIIIVTFAFVDIIKGIALLIIATAIFYVTQKKFFRYSPNQIIIKAVVYLIFACTFRFLACG